VGATALAVGAFYLGKGTGGVEGTSATAAATATAPASATGKATGAAAVTASATATATATATGTATAAGAATSTGAATGAGTGAPAASSVGERAALTLLGDGTLVSVDGVARGASPVKLAIDPGQHAVLFTFPATGESKGTSLTLKAGDKATLRADFTGAAPTIRVQR
jgi:hypothetical protein